MKEIKATTIEEAIESESAVMALINLSNHDIAVAVLTVIIGEAVLYFNVGKSMGPNQIKGTIEMLLSDHVLKNLKPEDYHVLFTDMKKGIYGQLYDRLDGQIIFENAHKYADKRQGIIEQKNAAEHNNRKTQEFLDSKNIDPRILKVLSEVKTELPKEERRSFTKDLTKPTFKEQDEKTKLVNQFFKEFDELHRTLPFKTKNPSDKFISYQGKVVDQIEYAKIKLEEDDRAI